MKAGHALAPILAGVALTACSAASHGLGPEPLGRDHARARHASSSPIQHVVIIVQENRSIDNLFNGFPGANTVTSGLDSHGGRIHLEPTSIDDVWSPDHSHGAFTTEFDDGKLDGWDRIRAHDFSGKPSHDRFYDYGFVPARQTVPYWTMAKQYALSDMTFQSNGGPSFPSHLYLIAGQSGHIAENASGDPWGCDAPKGTTVAYIDPNTGKEIEPGFFPCLTRDRIALTLADELDAAGLSWRYYAPQVPGKDFGENWNVFDAIKYVRHGPDWQNVVSPETQVLTDVQNGYLANVTWIAPAAANSDHAGVDTKNGPSWVTSIVNTIGQSQFWNSTAIFVIWDDWGGWYDHVAPPQYDYEGNGFRVPLIAISPYALQGVVSHTQHETASTLRFIENRFGLGQMSVADSRASDLIEMFDFSQSPRPFQTIPQPVKTEELIRASQADHRAPDND
jgi:phospholipase C